MTRWALIIVVTLVAGSCSTQPVQGGFQQVCDKLVAMSPGERAMNMGANGPYYQKTYKIFYDPMTDAIYTKSASGERDYILKGDFVRAAFLIDNKHSNSQNDSK